MRLFLYKMGLIFDIVVMVPVVFLSIAISIGISQPFQGALVRLRANYLPKAVSLDNVMEDGEGSARRVFAEFVQSQEARATAKIGPVVPGILAMIRRTYRLEGWPGLYKGSLPTAAQLIWLSLITWIFFDLAPKGVVGGGYKAAPSGPGQFSFWTNIFYMFFISLAALPLNVITYR